MVDLLLSLVAFLVFFAAVAWYLRRALVGDIGFSPTKFFGIVSVVFLVAVYLLTDISVASFFLLLVAVVSAYKVFSSALYGDLAWGYVLLFIVVVVVFLLVSAYEMAGLIEGAKSHLYSNSTNTSQVSNFTG